MVRNNFWVLLRGALPLAGEAPVPILWMRLARSTCSCMIRSTRLTAVAHRPLGAIGPQTPGPDARICDASHPSHSRPMGTGQALHELVKASTESSPALASLSSCVLFSARRSHTPKYTNILFYYPVHVTISAFFFLSRRPVHHPNLVAYIIPHDPL